MGNEFYDEEVANKFVDYFHNFLGSCDETYPIDMPDDIFKTKVDAMTDLHMVRDVLKYEIKSALFDIKDDKAPGPDGFTSKNFKASWDIMRNDLCSVVQELFISGKILDQLLAAMWSISVLVRL
uniref:RNA-directed DNA polymerase, eukaryota, reverse transcriptase zinc-binding domain protein n=1 Tax=Tanacetum cinerariifolium TaxID=118510 RepID=A0A699L7P8_TANCI|nr:hypothetical protein [Tanacetum cinerariifolium]